MAAALFAAGLVIVGLWAWQSAADIAIEYWSAARPEVAAWAVRSGAVAAIAAAQAILMSLVAGRVYRRGMFDAIVGLAAGAVFAISLVSAVACGLAGR
jgi:hypothetical protein